MVKISSSYFDHDVFSNSFLTILREKVKSESLQKLSKEDPEFYRFGREFEDVLLYNQETTNELIKKMVKVVRANSFYRSIIDHPYVERQFEIFDKFYDLNFKCKLDLFIPGIIVPDIKSTNAKSFNSFLKSIQFFDYDRQIYVYMTMAKVDKAALIGCSKEYHPKAFIVTIKKGDAIYESGKKKTEELITLLKSLL